MPSSLIAAAIVDYFAIESVVAIAAVRLATAVVTTAVIASAINRSQQQDLNAGDTSSISNAKPGNRVQLPPSTINKVPVVYGTAWVKPIIIDAKISTDNQTMWYAMVFSEVTDYGTLHFDSMYWGDSLINFNADGYTVDSITGSDGTVDTKVGGSIKIYRYTNGGSASNTTYPNAWEVLSDSRIDSGNRWTVAHTMDKVVGIVVEIKYNADAGITGLVDITASITNTLTLPGSVIQDYLQSTRYGMGIDSVNIDFNSLTELNAYSDELIYYTPHGGGAQQSAPRYRFNGVVDTSKSFLSNLNGFTDSCDSWVSWNEVNAQWSITANRPYDPAVTPRRIGPDQILGGIDIQPIDLNSTYNSVEVQFPNTLIKDQSSFFTYDLAEFSKYNNLRSPYEHDNQLKLVLPFTNNVVEAQYVAARRMLQSRIDITITFTMDYSGLQIDAGDVIGIDHDYYGWGSYSTVNPNPYPLGRLFRVQQVAEQMDGSGNLSVRIAAISYDADIYDDNNIALQESIPQANTGLADPNYVSKPDAPTIPNNLVNLVAKTPTFTVQAVVPSKGAVVAMEFWYSTESDINSNNYTLWFTEQPSGGTAFTAGATVSTVVSGLKAGNYYWRVRASSPRSKSPYSDASTIVHWDPTVTSLVTGLSFIAQFQPAAYTIPVSPTGAQSFTGITPILYAANGASTSTFVTAQTDNASSFVANTWRIGLYTNTGWSGVFTDGITLSTSTIVASTSTLGAGAKFATPTTSTKTLSSLTVPIRYKDSLGNAYSGGQASVTFAQVRDGNPGQNGTNGSNGSNGSNGTNGFVTFAYVEIETDPTTLNNYTFLTTAFTNAAGRAPVNLDGATFYYTISGVKQLDDNGAPIHKYFTYYTSGGWQAAAVEIAGDLISTGTIRGQSLVAEAIYSKSYQSNNATLNDTGSVGTWINGQNGNARFAGNLSIGNSASIGNNLTIGTNLTVGNSANIGDNLTVGNNVTIGQNLTVTGLINGGQLGAGVVDTHNLTPQLVSYISTASSGSVLGSAVGTAIYNPTATFTSYTDYDWYYSFSYSYGGYVKTIARSEGIPTARLTSSGSASYNFSFSCNLTFSGANAYPNGPIFILYANWPNSNNGYQHGGTSYLYQPTNGTPVPPGGNTTNGAAGSYEMAHTLWRSGTSYSGPLTLNATFSAPGSTLSGNPDMIVGVAMINGNGQLYNAPGTFSLTNIQWSATIATL